MCNSTKEEPLQHYTSSRSRGELVQSEKESVIIRRTSQKECSSSSGRCSSKAVCVADNIVDLQDHFYYLCRQSELVALGAQGLVNSLFPHVRRALVHGVDPVPSALLLQLLCLQIRHRLDARQPTILSQDLRNRLQRVGESCT